MLATPHEVFIDVDPVLPVQEATASKNHLCCLLVAEPTAGAAAAAGCLHVLPRRIDGEVAIYNSHGTGPMVPRILRTAHKARSCMTCASFLRILSSFILNQLHLLLVYNRLQ
jgi:hypothetical protein